MGKIAEITVPTGGQATIDFTAIPATYKHLVFTLSARTNGAYIDTDLALTVNGDTSASYDDQYLSTTGASGGGSAATGATSARAGLTAGANAVAGVFAETSIEILNYASTTFRKTWQVETFDHGNDAGNGFKIIESGQWRNTAAITRLTLTPPSGSFVVGTVATLYGVDPLTAPGAGFLLAHNTNAASGVIQVGADTTETIITGLDVTLAGAATAAPIPLNWNVWISQSHSGVVKGCALRLRRTNAAGALLASLALGDPGGDSVAGHQQQWRDTLFDDSPTDGHYVMTIQNTQAVGSTFYSDTHQLWLFAASAS